jgi:hypothetical protein
VYICVIASNKLQSLNELKHFLATGNAPRSKMSVSKVTDGDYNTEFAKVHKSGDDVGVRVRVLANRAVC